MFIQREYILLKRNYLQYIRVILLKDNKMTQGNAMLKLNMACKGC